MQSLYADRRISQWTFALFLLIGLAFLLVVGVLAYGICGDFEQIRETLFERQAERLRSHGERTVRGVVRLLESQKENPDLTHAEVAEFVRTRWETSVGKDYSRLYGAIVNLDGKIVIHHHPQFEGAELEEMWYERVVAEAGEDVVESKSKALTGGHRVLDVRVPIVFRDRLLGNYHSGLSYDWLDKELADEKRGLWNTWSWILAAMLAVISFAGWTLWQINLRVIALHSASAMLKNRRFTEIGQLVSGIVHEIRNPLNAMRLNLHVVEHFLNSQRDLATPEGSGLEREGRLTKESIEEIERIEALMCMLLGYVRPQSPRSQSLDVRKELELTLQFFQPFLERSDIAVTAKFSDSPAAICIDRERFRQIIINLLNNAIDATGKGGRIQIQVQPTGASVEILVEDNGPGVSSADRDRIFDPFYTQKKNGNGLGLALVRKYVEEVDGMISCEPNQPSGARFRMRFPLKADLPAQPLVKPWGV